jgi:hypothetical protein
MKVLTASQIENLNNFIDDNTIGDVQQYASDEKIFITDKRIEKALRDLAADAPRRFNGVQSLYKALKSKGLKSSQQSLRIRILPILDAEKGLFNDDIYALASMFFEPGYLEMEAKEKMSKTSVELWNSYMHRKKMGKIFKKRWNSEGYREKISKVMMKANHENEAINEAIGKAIDKLPPPSKTEKTSISQIVRMICDIDKSLNNGTVRSRLYKSQHFNQTIYDRIRPYLKTRDATTVVFVMPAMSEISTSFQSAISRFIQSNSR